MRLSTYLLSTYKNIGIVPAIAQITEISKREWLDRSLNLVMLPR